MVGSSIWAPVGDKGPDGDPGPIGPEGPQGPPGGPGPDAATFAAFLTQLADQSNPLYGAAMVGRGIQVVKTITALRAVLKTVPGKQVFVTGYYSQGDGGGGHYYLDAADTTTADNGGNIIVATDGARWKLMFTSSISIKQFGATGLGVVNESPFFDAAKTALPASVQIYVPGGTYKLDTTVTATGRRFTLSGAALTGVGKLSGAIITYFDPTNGTSRFGVGNPLQYGTKYAFGGNHHGPLGLQIGGGDLNDGPDGNLLYADGYGGWTVMQPSKYPGGAVELAVQPASIAGTCTVAAGDNKINRVVGGNFETSIVGKRIYIGNGQIYLIQSVNSINQVTVTTLSGAAVSFAASATLTYVVVYVSGTGLCNVSGTTVTRISGDPFVTLGNGDDKFVVDGVKYQLSGPVTDANTATLSTNIGTKTNVSYEFWTTIDNLSAALRVHRIAGATFEENITIGAYADGNFHIQAAGGVGRQYPLYIGSGYDSRGKRKQLTMDGTNGSTKIGGDYDRCTVEIAYSDVLTNWLYFAPGLPGSYGPSATPMGPDSNIGFNLSAKGNGAVTINNAVFKGGFNNTVSENSFVHLPYGGGGTQYGITLRPVTNTATAIAFYNAAGAIIGSVAVTATATVYNTSSDYRLKENVVPMTGALERISKLNPVTYRWKSDHSIGEGFIAHQLQEVIELAVTGEKDDPTRYQAIDNSKIVPVLTAAIKELRELVLELKQEVLELKTKG